jgi:hypothetical protein
MSDWDNLVEPTRGALENKLYAHNYISRKMN